MESGTHFSHLTQHASLCQALFRMYEMHSLFHGTNSTAKFYAFDNPKALRVKRVHLKMPALEGSSVNVWKARNATILCPSLYIVAEK